MNPARSRDTVKRLIRCVVRPFCCLHVRRSVTGRNPRIQEDSSCRQPSGVCCPAQTASASATTWISGRMASFTCGRAMKEHRWSHMTGAAGAGTRAGRSFCFTAAVKGPAVRGQRAANDSPARPTGRPIQSSLPYELTSDGALTSADLSLVLQGMFRYMADVARFEDCLTGRSYPVAMEDEYVKLERAYLKVDKPEPGAPLMASFEGDITHRSAIDGGGPDSNSCRAPVYRNLARSTLRVSDDSECHRTIFSPAI